MARALGAELLTDRLMDSQYCEYNPFRGLATRSGGLEKYFRSGQNFHVVLLKERTVGLGDNQWPQQEHNPQAGSRLPR